MLACVWCGPAFALIFAIGFVGFTGFLPPPSPNDSAEEIVAIYQADLDAIRIGCILMMIATPLLAPWGVALAYQTKRAERGPPVIAGIQMTMIGVIVLTIIIVVILWTVAAFRVGEISPEVTQTLNDLAFFFFIFDWSPFCLWVGSFAVLILMDRSERPIFPRWLGYLNLWIVLMSVPGCLIAFFKTGPFAFNGLVAFYFPVVVFFIWLVAMTVTVIRAINAESEEAGELA